MIRTKLPGVCTSQVWNLWRLHNVSVLIGVIFLSPTKIPIYFFHRLNEKKKDHGSIIPFCFQIDEKFSCGISGGGSICRGQKQFGHRVLEMKRPVTSIKVEKFRLTIREIHKVCQIACPTLSLSKIIAPSVTTFTFLSGTVVHFEPDYPGMKWKIFTY